MMRAGAERGASGENAIVRTVAEVDVIIGLQEMARFSGKQPLFLGSANRRPIFSEQWDCEEKRDFGDHGLSRSYFCLTLIFTCLLSIRL